MKEILLLNIFLFSAGTLYTQPPIKSLIELSLAQEFTRLEQKHSVPEVLVTLTKQPIETALPLLYRIVFSSKVYTPVQRKDIVEQFLTLKKNYLSFNEQEDLKFILKQFINYAIKKNTPGILNLNATINKHGDTFLFKLTKINKTNLMRHLIAAGAQVNAKNQYGKTPLFYATTVPTAQLLLDKGAAVNPTDRFGQTVLFIYDNIDPGVIALLVHNGADANAINNHDQSALTYAATQGNKEVITELLCNGANVNAINTRNETVLDYLIFQNELEPNKNFADMIIFIKEKGGKQATEL